LEVSVFVKFRGKPVEPVLVEIVEEKDIFGS